MSVLGLTKLAWDLEHETGLLERYRRDPEPVLDAYQLTEAERAAVRAFDPHPLLAVGLNPVVLRNLFVILGVAHGEIYAPRPDRPAGAQPQPGAESMAGPTTTNSGH